MIMKSVSVILLCELIFLVSIIQKSFPLPLDVYVRKNHLLQAKMALDVAKCDLLVTHRELSEIASYKEQAEKIIQFITKGSFKGESFRELTKFVEKHPFRPSGHENLEIAIDYLMNLMKGYGLSNIRSEAVKVPMWNASRSRVDIVRPIERELRLLAIQNTVESSGADITAHALVVRSFEELERMKDQVAGKIVVFNQGYLGMGRTSIYKANGASYAAQYGALAALIQSTGYPQFDSSSATPVDYWPNVTKIPSAIISMDDANKLRDIQDMDKEIMLHVHITGFNEPTEDSRNAIGELPGHLKKEYVALLGHTDCTNEEGGTSDASSLFVSLMALAAIKNMRLTPHRTILAVLLTGSEEGLWGSVAYNEKHRSTLGSYSVVMQSDGGAFKPYGIDFAGSEKAGCLIHEIIKLCEPLMATDFARFPTVSSDAIRFIAEGVPGLSLMTEDKVRMTKRHKQEMDNITAVESDEFDAAVALWSVVSYIIADLPNKIPRY